MDFIKRWYFIICYHYSSPFIRKLNFLSTHVQNKRGDHFFIFSQSAVKQANMIYEENISLLVTSSSNPSDRVDLLPDESTAISSKLRSSFTPKVLFLFALLVIFGIANNVTGRWAQLKFGERYAFFGYQVRHTSVPINYSIIIKFS